MGNFDIESVLTCLVFSRSSCCWLSKCILKTQNISFLQFFFFFWLLVFSRVFVNKPDNCDWANLPKKLHIYKLLEGAEKLRPLMLQPTFVLFLQMNILIKAEKFQSQAESKSTEEGCVDQWKNRSAKDYSSYAWWKK